MFSVLGIVLEFHLNVLAKFEYHENCEFVFRMCFYSLKSNTTSLYVYPHRFIYLSKVTFTITRVFVIHRAEGLIVNTSKGLHLFILYLEISESKSVNPVLDIIRVNSLRLGDLHLLVI